MRYNTIAVAYIVVVILIAHAVSPGSYLWRSNTISELAAQGYERAWLMRIGFTGFGLCVVVGALRRYRDWPSLVYRDAFLLLYGLGMILAGVFSAPSWVDAVAYAPREAALHSLMATVAGVSISLAVFLSWIRDPESSRRPGHALALVLIVLLSGVFGMGSREAGLIQRLLYLVGFAWLVFIELPPVMEKPRPRLFAENPEVLEQEAFNRWFLDQFVATYPEWVVDVQRYPQGDSEYVELHIPPPPGQEEPIAVLTADCEIVLWYHAWHAHFDTFLYGPLVNVWNAFREYLEAILNEKLVAVSEWQGEEWRGTRAAPPTEEIKPKKGRRIEARSWKGTYTSTIV